MQATVKDWFFHFTCPHNMHEVSEECHDMMHDQVFWTVMVLTIAVIAMISLAALGYWLEPTAPAQYLPYRPYYM